MLKRFRRDNRGATAVEYGVILLMIALAIVGSLDSISNAINSHFNSATNTINNSID